MPLLHVQYADKKPNQFHYHDGNCKTIINFYKITESLVSKVISDIHTVFQEILSTIHTCKYLYKNLLKNVKKLM